MKNNLLQLSALSLLVGLAAAPAIAGATQSSLTPTTTGFTELSGQGATLLGTNGNDTVFLNSGSIGHSTIYDDLVYANGGDDRIFVNDGNDTVYGGAGDDEIGGGDGNDVLYGQDGNDTLFGGAGDDKLYGGAGSDTIYGGSGNDVISAVRIDGGKILAKTELRSIPAPTRIYGGSGNDRIIVSSDSDAQVFGEQGNDTYIVRPSTGKAADYAQLQIVDGDGYNTLIIEGASFDSLRFEVSGDMLQISDKAGKAPTLSIGAGSISSFRFADTTLSSAALQIKAGLATR